MTAYSYHSVEALKQYLYTLSQNTPTFLKRLFLLTALMMATATIAAQDNSHHTPLSNDSTSALYNNNAPIAGTWRYSAPAVEFASANLLSSMGKPIAKGKVKKGLKKIYKKLKINNRRLALQIDPKGSYTLTLLGAKTVSGTYTYNPVCGILTLDFRGFKLPCHVKTGKKMSITWESDHLLKTLHFISTFVHNKALQDLSTFSRNYDNVQLGIELKQ